MEDVSNFAGDRLIFGKPIQILNTMAAGLNEKDAMDMLQAVQYWDDSVDAWFRDGSKLFLTGCGTASTYWGSARAPNCGGEGVYRLSCYAVSECRDKVAAVLTFRNRFADRVSLTRSLVEEQRIQVRNQLNQSHRLSYHLHMYLSS